jgi:nucleotide-binding universal stress UspA family protein
MVAPIVVSHNCLGVMSECRTAGVTEVDMYERILVPLERRGAGEAHVQHAANLAASVDAEVILLSVITVVSSDEYVFKRIQIEAGSSGAQRKAEAEAQVTGLAGRLREQGIAVEPVVIISDKAEDEAIVEYASQANCDLIVLPNQRRSLVSRWLQGNVPARVQRRSGIPILLVKEED